MSLLMEALNKAESENKLNTDVNNPAICLIENINPLSTSALKTLEPDNTAVDASVSIKGSKEFTSVVINASAESPDAPDVNQDRESAKKLVHASNKRYGRSFKTVIVVVTSLVMIALASALVMLEQRAAPQVMSFTPLVPETSITQVTETPLLPASVANDLELIAESITEAPDTSNTFAITDPIIDTNTPETAVATSQPESEPELVALESESDSVITAVEADNSTDIESLQQSASETLAVQPVDRTTGISIIRSTDVQTTRQMAERAILLISARQYPQAAELLEQILTLQPASIQALMLYGSLQLSLGNQSRASEMFSRVISLDPGNISARVGFLQSIPGYSADDLIREFSRLQQNSPDNHLLAFELGRAFATQSRWTEAARSFNRALELAGSSTANNQVLPDYAFNLAVSLDRRGERMQAIRYYNEALDRAGSSQTGFDQDVVKQRVIFLSGR